MNKFLLSALAAAVSAAFLCGCSSNSKVGKDEASEAPSSESIAQTEEASAEPTTVPVVKAAEGTFVYDNAKILSEDELKECNNYVAWLYEDRLINAAVITTNDLGEKTPWDYANEAYEEIYSGGGSGLILLINNDTSNDLLLKTGSCESFISDDDENLEFYSATKEIVADDYKNAVLRLMKLGEKCPEHIFDNAGTFSAEQSANIDKSLAGCDKDISILITTNQTGSTNEEILEKYYSRRYPEGTGCMILIETSGKVCISKAGTEFGDISEAVKKASEFVQKGDNFSAVNSIIGSFGGESAEAVTTVPAETTSAS